jgi:hypothetical protein
MRQAQSDIFLRPVAIEVVQSSAERQQRQVPHCYLEECLSLKKKIVPNVRTELLFNLDETELSDSEDHKSKSILFPASEEESKPHSPIDRFIR